MLELICISPLQWSPKPTMCRWLGTTGASDVKLLTSSPFFSSSLDAQGTSADWRELQVRFKLHVTTVAGTKQAKVLAASSNPSKFLTSEHAPSFDFLSSPSCSPMGVIPHPCQRDMRSKLYREPSVPACRCKI